MSPTVTKVLCPVCEGSGLMTMFWIHQLDCRWCHGARKLKTELALNYANLCEVIADGGFLAGDHDEPEMLAGRAKAQAIRDFVATCRAIECQPIPH